MATRSAGIVWRVPPSELAKALDRYGANLMPRIGAELEHFGQGTLKPDAQANAPWQDRTGNARSGIFTATEVQAKRAVLHLSHGVVIDYGIYLELAHAGKYAALLPSIERNAPELIARLQRLLR